MHPKVITVFLPALFFTAIGIAQPVIKAQRTIGGTGTEGLNSLYITSDQGIIAGGYSNSNASFEKTENSRGYEDYWVVKLNSHGTIEWDKTIGGSFVDQVTALQQTSDGGYILGGWSDSYLSGDKTENSRGSNDYWVVKLTSQGSIEWQKTIGGFEGDALYAIQQTMDGGYILGGWSRSNISGEKTANSRGDYDYWVVKLNSQGVIEWDKTIGGSAGDALQSLVQTTDGGFLLGGWSYSSISGEKTANSHGAADYWIIKLNRQGTILWDKTIGGNDVDLLQSLVQTADGGYLLGGSSYSGSSGDKTENSRGSYDYWIVKLNNQGVVEWDKTMGGAGAETLGAVQQTKDGGYICGGSSPSNAYGEKTENSRGGNDYWLVKLTGAGMVEWDKTIGGAQEDYLKSVKEIAKNNYIAGGYSNSGKTADKTQLNRGPGVTTDFWLVQIQYKPLAIAHNNKVSKAMDIKTTVTDFTVFPVPAKDRLSVQCKTPAVFALYNAAGTRLLSQKTDGNTTISVETLSTGVYYLKNTLTGSAKKIIISR